MHVGSRSLAPLSHYRFGSSLDGTLGGPGSITATGSDAGKVSSKPISSARSSNCSSFEDFVLGILGSVGCVIIVLPLLADKEIRRGARNSNGSNAPPWYRGTPQTPRGSTVEASMEAHMPRAAKDVLPLMRRDAELLTGGMAAVAIFTFLGLALATTMLELARLVVAATSG